MRSAKQRSWAVLGCVCAMVAASWGVGTGKAALIVPGAAITAPPAPGTAGGTLLANSGPISFTAATFAGVLTSKVFVNDPANPFGPGFMTFTYQFSNAAGVPASIDRMTVDGFGLPGLQVDASFQPGPGVQPTSFDRSIGPGDTMGTSFTPPSLGLGVVLPGQSSELLVMHTNMQVFNSSVASFIDGSTVSGVFTFAPRAVPEPATIAVAGIGAAGLLVRRKR